VRSEGGGRESCVPIVDRDRLVKPADTSGNGQHRQRPPAQADRKERWRSFGHQRRTYQVLRSFLGFEHRV